ncbi:hypothetical protein [Pseudomonas mediterranea]|uniref:hypothetical protein n=1 Tax=Pseudomonas mediterranea TaxID=183795 RepID=UPI0006D8C260|nr:hypothetical protein [Pseudomonas mediterranea]
MTDKIPIKLVDLGGGQGALKEFEAGDTIPLSMLPPLASTTDDVPEGTTNLYFTQARVRAAPLTGFVATNSAITAADTVLSAAGKAQGQIDTKANAGANSDITSLVGLTTPLSVAQGGTGGNTQVAAQTALGGTTVGRAVFTAVSAAAGRTAITAAASGANSDITSLTGLTTALSVSQGGTGGNTQATARTGLGLGTSAVMDILGTVAQTGGVPTGSIIESGTNTNGVYVKFADGTMFCSKALSNLGALAAGATATFNWVFPQPFSTTAGLTVSFPLVDGPASTYSASFTVTDTTVTYYAITAKTNSRITFLAQGRWF